MVLESAADDLMLDDIDSFDSGHEEELDTLSKELELSDDADHTTASHSSLSPFNSNNYLDHPLLSLEKEQELAQLYYHYQENLKDPSISESDVQRKLALDAAHQLVMAHMKYVVKLAKQYINYGLPVSDLIQEGAIGLMKAVQNFNPYKGVRLISFAIHWIKSEMHNYIVKNWRQVKIATTKAQRKLFFNFRKLSNQGPPQEKIYDRNQRIARALDVTVEDVEHMSQRFASAEQALEHPVYVSGPDLSNTIVADFLPSSVNSPQEAILEERSQIQIQNLLKNGLALLNARDKEIIQARFFSDEPKTLKEIAEKMGVSIERVRQLEKKALMLLKSNLLASNYFV